MRIFVVGSGKLARAILSTKIFFPSCEVLEWKQQYHNLHEKTILIHAGSGRQLEDCFAYCKRTESVLIELSTGLETELIDPDFPLIVCPNTSILILKTMHMLNITGKSFANYKISITESHQSAKTTEPGTAYAFARALGISTDRVVSIREPAIQLHTVGIPEEYLERHAYHKIVIEDGSDQLTIETKVLGHDSYAAGVKMIVGAVLRHQLSNKRYSVLDLIQMNLL